MSIPLAERLRPSNLDHYIGQSHLVGKGAVLRNAIESGTIPSMIFWGPPGVGKTTLAHIISQQLKRPFYALSAINSGVKDIREVIEKAKSQAFFGAANPILFIDEIHRFSKSQQDSLLGAVEKGVVTLVGATTENPSFEVISALLSRCQVYILKNLSDKELIALLDIAIKEDEILRAKQFASRFRQQIEDKKSIFQSWMKKLNESEVALYATLRIFRAENSRSRKDALRPAYFDTLPALRTTAIEKPDMSEYEQMYAHLQERIKLLEDSLPTRREKIYNLFDRHVQQLNFIQRAQAIQPKDAL